MANDPTLTVLIVDDDEAIRTSLARALQKRGYTVETYPSAIAFLESYSPTTHGCLVLDHGMPGMTGLELQTELDARGSTLPLIFITGHGGVPESVQAIKGGAVDFLEKPFRQSVLLERIETAFDITRKRLSAESAQRDTRARFERLTAREQEIVDQMIANPSAISSKEIGARLEISPRTVDHHRARILEKLNVRSVAELMSLTQRAQSTR